MVIIAVCFGILSFACMLVAATIMTEAGMNFNDRVLVSLLIIVGTALTLLPIMTFA